MSESKKLKSTLKSVVLPKISEDFTVFPDFSNYPLDVQFTRAKDPYIQAYEREVLYVEECALSGTLRTYGRYKKRPAAGEYEDHLLCSDLDAASWAKRAGEAPRAYEDFCVAKRNALETEAAAGGPPASFDTQQHKTVVDRFEALFPNDDVLVRESSERGAAEAFCEMLARDIVQRSAQLYLSRCFDRAQEGYTAFALWDEIRVAVAEAFLPQDFLRDGPGAPSDPAPTPFFGHVPGLHRRTTDAFPPSHHNFGLFAASAPPTLLMSATDRLTLADRPAPGAEHHAGAVGPVPPSIPIDDYCRYVVEVESQKPSPAEASADTGAGRVPKSEQRTPSGVSGGFASASRAHSVAADTEPASASPTRPSTTQPNARKTGPKKKRAAANAPRASTRPEPTAEELAGTKEDEFSTALKKVADGAGSLGLTNLPLSATRSDKMSESEAQLSTTASRTKLKKNMVEIVGSDVVPQRSVEKDRKRAAGKQAKTQGVSPNATASGVSYAVLPSPAVDADTDADGAAAASRAAENAPAAKSGGKVSKAADTSSQYMSAKDKAREQARRRQQELQAAREHEMRFIQLPAASAEEQERQRKEQLTVEPRAGVVVQRPAQSREAASGRPAPRSRRDEPQVIASGGAFVVPNGRQTLSEFTASQRGRSNSKKRGATGSVVDRKPGGARGAFAQSR